MIAREGSDIPEKTCNLSEAICVKHSILRTAEKRPMRECGPRAARYTNATNTGGKGQNPKGNWGWGNDQEGLCFVGKAEENGNAVGKPDSNIVTVFDVFIGMDWLRRHHAVIVCDKKLVRVPFGNETLSSWSVIISATKEDDKSGGKQVKDVPIVRDFPEVFPEDLPGLPPVRPVEFQIDLIPGAALISYDPVPRLEARSYSVKKKDGSFKICFATGSLAGYYRRFIEGFSKIAKSMTKLTQKGIKFDWGEKEEDAFQLIKQKLCSAPILALPEGVKYLYGLLRCITQRLRARVNEREMVMPMSKNHPMKLPKNFQASSHQI
ncbi:hypothetical protein Tco_0282845 [Tanacetum coccineum]